MLGAGERARRGPRGEKYESIHNVGSHIGETLKLKRELPSGSGVRLEKRHHEDNAAGRQEDQFW